MSKPVALPWTSPIIHQFDTLYHALYLQVPESIFLTADAQYFRKAAKLGHIIELKNFLQTG